MRLLTPVIIDEIEEGANKKALEESEEKNK